MAQSDRVQQMEDEARDDEIVDRGHIVTPAETGEGNSPVHRPGVSGKAALPRNLNKKGAAPHEVEEDATYKEGVNFDHSSKRHDER